MKKLCVLIFILFLNETVTAQQNNFDNTTLLGQLNPNRGGYANIWGYAANGREYALIGAYTGTSIIDVTNPSLPVEVAFISSVSSSWRELRTYQNYAYVVTEGSGVGLQIIDLSNLPNSATLVAADTTGLGTSGRVHTIHIEGKYAYLMGSQTKQGVIILDLTNPVSPVKVGSYSAEYWHDSVIKNDTIYASAIYGDGIMIFDANDKSNIQLISQTQYPGNFTHNIWPTADNNYIVQTDEIHGMPLKFWDVTDKSNLELKAEAYLGKKGIAHNAHVKGDFVYVAYYFDGIKIFDLSNRNAPVEVGHYDTYPGDNMQRGSGYTGAWGVYPYLPSGNILVSDMVTGLYVVGFNNTKGGHIKGVVKDNNQLPLSDVKIELLSKHAGETSMKIPVGADGNYIFGAKPGNHNFRFYKYGYEEYLLNSNQINSGQTSTENVSLTLKAEGSVTPVFLNSSNQPLSEINFTMLYEDFTAQYVLNSGTTLTIPYGTYTYQISNWGYEFKAGTVEIKPNEIVNLEIKLSTLFYETFDAPQLWTAENSGNRYNWGIGTIGNGQLGDYRFLGFDHYGSDEGRVAYSWSVATAGSGNPASNSFISPVMDASNFAQPIVSFYKYYNPYGYNTLDAKDSLCVYVSSNSGQSWNHAKTFKSIDNNWVKVEFPLTDYITPTQTVQLKFVNTEGFNSGIRYSSFAMIDDVILGEKTVVDSIEEHNPTELSFELSGNYPNPFNPSTTISWKQSLSGSSYLKIYNSLGQLVYEKSVDKADKGENKLLVNLERLSSGIYFYHIISGNTISRTAKMTLIK